MKDDGLDDPRMMTPRTSVMVEGEEILGIIKGKAPVLKHDEDAAKPKRNSSNARQGGSLTTLRETSSLKTGPVTL